MAIPRVNLNVDSRGQAGSMVRPLNVRGGERIGPGAGDLRGLLKRGLRLRQKLLERQLKMMDDARGQRWAGRFGAPTGYSPGRFQPEGVNYNEMAEALQSGPGAYRGPGSTRNLANMLRFLGRDRAHEGMMQTGALLASQGNRGIVDGRTDEDLRLGPSGIHALEGDPLAASEVLPEDFRAADRTQRRQRRLSSFARRKPQKGKTYTNKDVPGYKEGTPPFGTIDETKKATVHEGEVVVPKDQVDDRLLAWLAADQRRKIRAGLMDPPNGTIDGYASGTVNPYLINEIRRLGGVKWEGGRSPKRLIEGIGRNRSSSVTRRKGQSFDKLVQELQASGWQVPDTLSEDDFIDMIIESHEARVAGDIDRFTPAAFIDEPAGNLTRPGPMTVEDELGDFFAEQGDRYPMDEARRRAGESLAEMRAKGIPIGPRGPQLGLETDPYRVPRTEALAPRGPVAPAADAFPGALPGVRTGQEVIGPTGPPRLGVPRDMPPEIMPGTGGPMAPGGGGPPSNRPGGGPLVPQNNLPMKQVGRGSTEGARRARTILAGLPDDRLLDTAAKATNLPKEAFKKGKGWKGKLAGAVIAAVGTGAVLSMFGNDDEGPAADIIPPQEPQGPPQPPMPPSEEELGLDGGLGGITDILDYHPARLHPVIAGATGPEVRGELSDIWSDPEMSTGGKLGGSLNSILGGAVGGLGQVGDFVSELVGLEEGATDATTGDTEGTGGDTDRTDPRSLQPEADFLDTFVQEAESQAQHAGDARGNENTERYRIEKQLAERRQRAGKIYDNLSTLDLDSDFAQTLIAKAQREDQLADRLEKRMDAMDQRKEKRQEKADDALNRAREIHTELKTSRQLGEQKSMQAAKAKMDKVVRDLYAAFDRIGTSFIEGDVDDEDSAIRQAASIVMQLNEMDGEPTTLEEAEAIAREQLGI